MTVEKYYALHDILAFSIIDDESIGSRLIKNWDIELRGFESNRRSSVDFTVVVGKFSPDNHDCTILDNNYYVRENYLYCRDSWQYARWQLEMTGFEQGEMTVRIDTNFLGKMFIPELIVNPIIWFKLNEKACPVVHASAVARDGQAYIFAGRGAAGKTTIALSLLEKGFKLLSEHFVVLGRDSVLSFPSPLHVMDYNLVPVLRNSMLAKHRASFRLKQLFHHATGKRLATKILPVDIIPDSLVDEAKLRSVFLLLPAPAFKSTRIEKAELIEQLVINQKLETIPFVRYMMEYAYLFPRSRMATYWTRYEENLKGALDSAEAFYRVEVPRRSNKGTIELINDMVIGQGTVRNQ